MDFTRSADLRIGTEAEHGAPRPDAILGRWVNANPDSRGMAEIIIRGDLKRSTLRVIGVGADGPIDWGEVAGELYANVEEEDSIATVAFTASFDFGFMETRFQIRPNKGILAAAHFTSFKDDSGRFDYVGREFFHRAESSGGR